MRPSFSQQLGLSPPFLQAFLRHAAQHSPYYREQDWAKNFLAGLPIRLPDIPITSKAAVLKSPQQFRSNFDPPSAGQVFTKHTSGSTGDAMPVFKSQSHFMINVAENQRLLDGWNIARHKVQVLYAMPTDEKPTGTLEATRDQNGNQIHQIFTRSAESIGKLVREVKATYVASRPSQLSAMLDSAEDHSFLRLLKTSTEAVSDEFRAQVNALPDCRIADLYGSVESGLIALSCAKCGKYHLAERNVVVEVLRDDDEPAVEGELGRVVVTVHNNPSMPLVRYDLGDMVRYSTDSSCQSGRMSFDRIYGRERMMFRLPSGERIIPALGAEDVLALGVKRFKLVQTTARDIEFRYMGLEPDLKLDHVAVQNMVARAMSPQFQVKSVLVTEFPLAPSGKYLMHERLIP